MAQRGRPQQDVVSVRNGLATVSHTGQANRRWAAGEPVDSAADDQHDLAGF